MAVKLVCGARKLGLILELDFGNTAIKWRRLKDDVICDFGRLAGSADCVRDLLLPELALVRVASVAYHDREADLRALLCEFGVPHEFAVSQPECAGVVNAYQDVSRMGVDRWLAMVAAFDSCGGACVVVDAGTALTIDVVARDGRHQGGYILPGAGLVLKALSDGTGRVRFGEEGLQSTVPGMNTDDCVHNGKWLGMVGAVKAALNEAESLIGGKYDVYITGGDGLAVKSLVGKNAVLWHYREDLVLDGLAPVLAKA